MALSTDGRSGVWTIRLQATQEALGDLMQDSVLESQLGLQEVSELILLSYEVLLEKLWTR